MFPLKTKKSNILFTHSYLEAAALRSRKAQINTIFFNPCHAEYYWLYTCPQFLSCFVYYNIVNVQLKLCLELVYNTVKVVTGTSSLCS